MGMGAAVGLWASELSVAVREPNKRLSGDEELPRVRAGRLDPRSSANNSD